MLSVASFLCLLPLSCGYQLKPIIDFDGQTMATPKLDSRPNILLVLADDLHNEPGMWKRYPNLGHLMNNGLVFSNHVSSSPLCGPSRASLIMGRYPHNTGYLNHLDSSARNLRKMHDRSMGKWLTDAGYYTAYLGKYANGLDGDPDAQPKGWRFWGGFTGEFDPYKQRALGGTYSYYNASQWQMTYEEDGETRVDTGDLDYPIKIWEEIHQADFLANQTLDHATIAIGMGRPFFIFTNPAMIHHGYCRGPYQDKADYAFDDPWREQNDFDPPVTISPCAKERPSKNFLAESLGDFRMHERTEEWNITAVGQKPWPTDCCTSEQIMRQKWGAQNRTASMLDLDDMLGFIIHGLERLQVLDNTYVFFTSDNGFHLGEKKQYFGKAFPYQTDIRTPLVVRVPHAAITGVRGLASSHVDIAATIADLADATAHVSPDFDSIDGKSFASLLRQNVQPDDWRSYSYSEIGLKGTWTWRVIQFVNEEQVKWSYHFWCTGEQELFNIQRDPHQMVNILDEGAGSENNSNGASILDEWMPVIYGMGTCTGSTCNSKNQVRKDVSPDDKLNPRKLVDCFTDEDGSLTY